VLLVVLPWPFKALRAVLQRHCTTQHKAQLQKKSSRHGHGQGQDAPAGWRLAHRVRSNKAAEHSC
jgi:hypothetical protein